MMKPTLKAVLLFAIGIPVALLIIAAARDFWYAAFYVPVAVLALTGADFMLALHNNRLQAVIKSPYQLFVGQTGHVNVKFEAKGYNRPLNIEALLELDGDADDPSPVNGKLEKGALEMDLKVVPRRRGQVAFKALWLRWHGPFGLIEIWRRQGIDTTIDVVPDVKGIYDAALQFFSRDAIYGVKTQRFKGEGTEFESLTEYMPGMDNRFIDWKRSATHRKLLCKEFRQERNHQIVLGFDTGHLMLEPVEGMPKLDHAIKAGLLLSWVSLYYGDLVGGCGFDVRFRSFLKPNRGMPYFTQFQRFTAGLKYETEETNFTLGLAEFNSRLQRRALVVLFTEFVDTISAELLLESLQLMVRKHVVVFATLKDPMLTHLQNTAPANFARVAEAVIADDFLRERSIVLERVARLGVHTIDVPAQGVSAALLNRYLMIKQRGLL